MSTPCAENNALMIDNYTGQVLNLVMVKVSRDSNGVPITNSDGTYQLDAVSSQTSVPLTTNGSTGVTTLYDWNPTYDGFSAQTADGKYAVIAGRGYASAPSESISLNSGSPDCFTMWAKICLYDGSNYTCVAADGTELTGMEEDLPGSMEGSFNNTCVVAPGVKYYGSSGFNWMLIFVVLIVIAIIIAIIVAVYKKYKST